MIAGVFSVHAASPRILPGMICSDSCLSARDVPVEAQAGILVSSNTWFSLPACRPWRECIVALK